MGKAKNVKTYSGPVEFKDDGEAEGAITARFATLEVVDRDGDYTEPGAFGGAAGQTGIKISGWNHSSMLTPALPVGAGRIYEDGKSAIFEGNIFTDTVGGRDLHETMKAMKAAEVPIEISYWYDATDWEHGDGKSMKRRLKKVDVFEVSPVSRGAGVDTALIGIKSDAGPAPTSDEPSEGVTIGNQALTDYLAAEASRLGVFEEKAT